MPKRISDISSSQELLYTVEEMIKVKLFIRGHNQNRQKGIHVADWLILIDAVREGFSSEPGRLAPRKPDRGG